VICALSTLNPDISAIDESASILLLAKEYQEPSGWSFDFLVFIGGSFTHFLFIYSYMRKFGKWSIER
jgi:hypothetical protein